MGCCSSREAGDDASPYPPVASTQAPDASSRHITTSSPPQPASLSSPRASHSHPTGDSRPNVPLLPIDPSYRAQLPSTLGSPTAGSHTRVTPLSDSVHAQWTRKRLEKERNDWWDTRTTGSAEIWRALRLMVESLQVGDVGEAQALLDAVECTCPNGMLWKGVFDGRGEWYRLPEWLVLEPSGIVEDVEVERVEDGKEGGAVEDEEALGEPVKVRCRLSSSGQDVVVAIRKGEKVGGLIAKVKGKAGINPFASVRIVYGGKIFDESLPLDSNPYWNYDSKHVLIAMVLE